MKVCSIVVFAVLIAVVAAVPAPQFLRGLLNGGGANNANAASQNFNTGINIPGIFGARFGASNAAANANSAGFGGASNSNAAAQSVGAGINVLGIDLGWGASNSASNSGGIFGR